MNFAERFILKEEEMSFLKKHISSWGTWLAILGPVIAFEMPSIHAYMTGHPGTALTTAIGVALTLYNSTAPKNKVSQ